MSKWMRQLHRWLAILFVGTVVLYMAIAAVQGVPPAWVTYAPLFPLLFMTITGLYMLIKPWTVKRRRQTAAN